MNLLEIFFIVSGIIIFIISLDVAKRQKFNALHFLVFLWIWAGLFVFTFVPEALMALWHLFWLQRGADVLVYSSIIFLVYFSILLLNKIEENRTNFTGLVRELALSQSPKKYLKTKIVFLVRVYNEAPVLKNTLDTLIKANLWEILVVNDGSFDESREILESYGETITTLHHLKNRGGWAALETWFEYLRRFWKGEYVCTFDADGQHQLEDFPKFLDVLEKNSQIQVVFWSRFIKKTKTNVWLVRKIVLKLWILFTFFVSHIKLTDSHNGFRVLRQDVIKNIKLTIDGMWYASEMIDIISEKKIAFREVPVNIIYTDYSRSKWQKSSNALNIAFVMIWNKFFK